MWLAAIQLVSGRRWQDNREQIAAELALLPRERPLLVLLPENFALFGERQGYLDGAETIGPDLSGAAPIQRQLAEWARDYGIWLVAGAMPTTIAGSDHIHTSTLVFDPSGDRKGHYHKIHLFDVDVADNHGRYRESETFSPGEEPVLVDSPFGPLGLSICYDLRFPELYRRLAPLGAAAAGPRHREPVLPGGRQSGRHPRDGAPDLGPQHGDRPLGSGAGQPGQRARHRAGAAGPRSCRRTATHHAGAGPCPSAMNMCRFDSPCGGGVGRLQTRWWVGRPLTFRQANPRSGI